MKKPTCAVMHDNHDPEVGIKYHAQLAKKSYGDACFHAVVAGIEMLKLNAIYCVPRGTQSPQAIKGTGFKDVLARIELNKSTAYRWMDAAKIVLNKLNTKLEDISYLPDLFAPIRAITDSISLNQLYLMSSTPQLGDTLMAIEEQTSEDKIKQIQLQGIKLLASLDEYASRDFAVLPKAEKKHICEVLRDQLAKLESSL